MSTQQITYSKRGIFPLDEQGLHSLLIKRDCSFLPPEVISDIKCLGESHHLTHARIFVEYEEKLAYLMLLEQNELVDSDMKEAQALSAMLYICPVTLQTSQRHYVFDGVLHLVPERDEDQGQAFWQQDVTAPILPVRDYTEMSQGDLDHWEKLLDMSAEFPYSPIRELQEISEQIIKE